MISLSTITADPDGNIVLTVDHDKSDLRTQSSRLSRTGTLDGGVVVASGGFSHGDRTPRIAVTGVDESLADRMVAFHQNNPTCHLAMADGFYVAAIHTLTIKGDGAVLTVYLVEKLS